METTAANHVAFDPSNPPFPMGPEGFSALVDFDMFGWRGQLGDGVAYGLEVVFAPGFFATEPAQAWSPDLVSVRAIGFGESSLRLLELAGVDVAEIERDVLSAVSREPWTVLEAVLDEGLSEDQSEWLAEMGLDEALCGKEVFAAFAKNFKISPVQRVERDMELACAQ